jgi:diphosphomevalonate decarboxylase
MTAEPAAVYLGAGSLEVMHAVRSWRGDGAGVAFTLDAGPNVHVLCEGRDAAEIASRLGGLGRVDEILENRPAGGARLVA